MSLNQKIQNTKYVLNNKNDTDILEESMDTIEIVRLELGLENYMNKYKSAKEIWASKHYGECSDNLHYPYTNFISKVTPVNDLIIHTNNLIEKLIDHKIRMVSMEEDEINYNKLEDSKAGKKYSYVQKFSDDFDNKLESNFFNKWRNNVRHNISHNIEPYNKLQHSAEDVYDGFKLCNDFMNAVYGVNISDAVDIMITPDNKYKRDYTDLEMCVYAFTSTIDNLNEIAKKFPYREDDFRKTVKPRIIELFSKNNKTKSCDIISDINFMVLSDCIEIRINTEDLTKILSNFGIKDPYKLDLDYYVVIRGIGLNTVLNTYPPQNLKNKNIKKSSLDIQEDITSIYIPIQKDGIDLKIEVIIDIPNFGNIYDTFKMKDENINKHSYLNMCRKNEYIENSIKTVKSYQEMIEGICDCRTTMIDSLLSILENYTRNSMIDSLLSATFRQNNHRKSHINNYIKLYRRIVSIYVEIESNIDYFENMRLKELSKLSDRNILKDSNIRADLTPKYKLKKLINKEPQFEGEYKNGISEEEIENNYMSNINSIKKKIRLCMVLQNRIRIIKIKSNIIENFIKKSEYIIISVFTMYGDH